MASSEWTEVISPERSLLSFRFGEVWRYRDLLWMFVVRDFVTLYKQTILGPLWLFVQPIFPALTFTVVFGVLAGISTDDVARPLFYLSGTICWGYFADCLKTSSMTFRTNQSIFGKVYFPRIVVPLSVAVSRLFRLGIQTTLFMIVFLAYFLAGSNLHPNAHLLLLPLVVILMAGLALGFGMLVSSMTTKYRDLIFLLNFGVQLLMYATPVIYPLSLMPEKWRWAIVLNPMTSLIETVRYAFFGIGAFRWEYLAYTAAFTVVLLTVAISVFNRTEKNFMDTV